MPARQIQLSLSPYERNGLKRCVDKYAETHANDWIPAVQRKLGDAETLPVCDTTLTERRACANDCGTYAGNLGPCVTWEAGANGRCAFCDHGERCHVRSEQRVFEEIHDLRTKLRDMTIERDDWERQLSDVCAIAISASGIDPDGNGVDEAIAKMKDDAETLRAKLNNAITASNLNAASYEALKADVTKAIEERDALTSSLAEQGARREQERDDLRAALDKADHDALWRQKALEAAEAELKVQASLRVTDINALKIKGAKALSDDLQAMRKRAHELETQLVKAEEEAKANAEAIGPVKLRINEALEALRKQSALCLQLQDERATNRPPAHDLTEDDALMFIAGAHAAYFNNLPSMAGPVTLWFVNKSDGTGLRSEWAAGGNVFEASKVNEAVLRFLEHFPLVDEEKMTRIRVAVARFPRA